MRTLKFLVVAVALVALLAGCKQAKKEASSSLPNTAGAIGDILVVISDDSWKGELGKVYQAVLEDQYPYLPQAEPYFKVSHVNKDVFSTTAVKYRNLIINKLGAEYKEPKFVIQRDVYAHPQVVVTVEAPNSTDAAIYVKENAARLREIFDQTEKDRYAAVVRKTAVQELSVAVQEKFGFDLYFPNGYELRTSKPNFMWISQETAHASEGLIIFTNEYKGQSSFTMENLVADADRYLKQYVPGPSEGSYMMTTMTVPPKVEKITYKGRVWYRMRGFWDVHKEFMGGPFISYSTYWEEKNEVLTLRAYVYSPKKDKRKPLLQAEALIYNINLDGEKPKTAK